MTKWYWVKHKKFDQLMWVVEYPTDKGWFFIPGVEYSKDDFDILRGPYTVEQINKELVFTGTIECNAIQVSHQLNKA